jgi:hypothetical protein
MTLPADKAEIILAGSCAILQSIANLEKLELSEVRGNFRAFLVQTMVDALRNGYYNHAIEIINTFKTLFDGQTEEDTRGDLSTTQ